MMKSTRQKAERLRQDFISTSHKAQKPASILTTDNPPSPERFDLGT